MALLELSKAQVLSLVAATQTTDQTLRRCRDAVVADPRDSYAIDTAPANVLRKSLELKFRIARQSGKHFDGDHQLLLALNDLTDQLVASVFVDEDSAHFDVYFAVNPLRLVGAVIMSD